MSELNLKEHWHGASVPVKVFVIIGFVFLACKAIPILSQVLTYILFILMLCVVFASQCMSNEDADKLVANIESVYEIFKKNLLGLKNKEANDNE